MNIQSNLKAMRDSWIDLGIANEFPSVHHFSSSKFTSNPAGLDAFYDWCLDREIRDENEQTLARAARVAELVRNGQEFSAAAASAWKEFPICTR